ncbi:TIC32 [Symbiodinium natans]|uniref:TIC32 protein n=1 Tax=Symbiodinium natans TaxID=878477 RepID=A0A812NS22_9DINO|nr:TIC32 [Symbiodinium natans]
MFSNLEKGAEHISALTLLIIGLAAQRLHVVNDLAAFAKQHQIEDVGMAKVVRSTPFLRSCTWRVTVAAALAAALTSSPLPIARAFLGIFGGGKSEERIPPAQVVGTALRSSEGPNKRSTAWEVLDTTRLPKQTALVTGANSGIGYYTALALAYGGAHVLLACRDSSRGKAAKKSMEEAIRAAGASASIEVVELDLASLSSIRSFTQSFLREGRPLHLLCLNAGIMAIPEFTTSKDGFEMQFATNHLGHFALTRALMNKLAESAPGRVVTLASEAHRNPNEAYDVDDWPPGAGRYGDWRAYQQSKLANILFARELSKRLARIPGGARVSSNAVHPGVISTPLGRQQMLKGSVLLGVLQDRTEVQGAATSVYCLTAPQIEGITGEYFRDCAATKPSKFATDSEAACRLWELSEELLSKSGFLAEDAGK